MVRSTTRKMEKQINSIERLGSLLSSRNALIRHEAAQALGRFPLSNPHVSDILRSNFQSNAWDTREAAVEALSAILKVIPHKDEVVLPRLQSISRLDLRDVIRTYHPLLSCEAELVTRMGDCSFGEQQKLVDEQLDFQAVAGISSGTFLSENDFDIFGSREATPKKKLDIANIDNIGFEDNLEESDRIVQSLCIHLMHDVIDVKWEVRHGAALAIACVLAVVPSRLSSSLVDVLATRLFQVIALDKFIDFSSGRTAVGPVREAVAECIARLTMIFPSPEFFNVIFSHVYILHEMTDDIHAKCHAVEDLDTYEHSWFQRQAALLIIKYHLAGPYYDVKFNEVFKLLLCSFEDSHDEVCASALSAVTTLFCKSDLKPEVSKIISHMEHVIYRFIDSACNISKNQLLDIDTVAVDLLSLLFIWLQGDSRRKLPHCVSNNLSHLLDPIHMTLSFKVVNVFLESFSRPSPLKDEKECKEFETCTMSILSSLFRIILFAAPQDTEDLIEACILCVHRIVEYFIFTKHLPQALVETIGRWMACLLIDARNAEIDLEKYNVCSDANRNSTEFLCGDEIRSLSDMVRIDVVLTRKLHVARFLAPLISTIYNFPLKIGDQFLSEAVQLLITPSMKSLIIMHRLGGVLLSHAWFTYIWRSGTTIDIPNYVTEILHSLIMSPNAAYDDEKMFFIYLENAYKDFASYCRNKGVSAAEIFNVEDTGDTIDNYASALYEICFNYLRQESDRETLRLRYESFKCAVATAKAVMTSNISRVNAVTVSSLLLIYPQSLLNSPSLNPFVKPLMELIRFEENKTFAQYALNSIPILFRIASEKKPNPHAKMIKQIVVSLVSCSNRFPEECKSQEHIISQCSRGPFSARSQNAEYVLRMLVTPVAATDMSSLLDFRNRDSSKETAMFMMAYSTYVDESRKQGIVPPHLSDIVLELKTHLSSENTVIRYCAAHCLCGISRINGFLRPVLKTVIAPLQEELRSGETQSHVRCGLAELLFLLSAFHVEMLGGLRLLAPISLRLMTDSCQAVREVGAESFRNFVPLMAIKANRKVEGSVLLENDMADEIFGENSIEFLLGDPTRLPELKLSDIKGLKSTTCLRHYQQEGIRWMSFLEEYGLSGILADDMGLGKTIQTLCLLAMKIHHKPSAKVLIVCPPTLVNHWCAEWLKFFPSLLPFHKIEEGCREKNKLLMNKHQIVTVASYNTVRFCSYFQEVEWFYLVLDEGHVIRNPTTQLFKTLISIKAQNRLILSGTPVQNTPADLWALFQFLMPGYLGTMKHFKSTFLNAINGSRNVNASSLEIKEGQSALDRLHKSILPFVMRRLKTDVLQDLPEKIVQDYMCSMTPVQRSVYSHIVEMYKLSQAPTSNGASLCALETIAELRKCTVHPALVSDKILKHSNILQLRGCVEESGKLIALRELLKQCGIGSRERYVLSDDFAVEENEICDNNSHRALIFCQRLSAVQLLVTLFDSGDLGSDIRYAVLDGSVPVSERHSVAEKFNVNPSIHVLILTTNIGGEGLNLIGADIVIFMEHDWNPVKDLQAMDRAHRIGQKCVVNVYRLITEGSIEQKIMRLQKFKIDTANALVGADNRSMQTMAVEQLVQLFTIDDTMSVDTCSAKKPNMNVELSSFHENTSSLLEIEGKLNIKELWDLSQYDRYSAHSVTQSFESLQRSNCAMGELSDVATSSESNVIFDTIKCKKLKLGD